MSKQYLHIRNARLIDPQTASMPNSTCSSPTGVSPRSASRRPVSPLNARSTPAG
jgi:hypothetical protein